MGGPRSSQSLGIAEATRLASVVEDLSAVGSSSFTAVPVEQAPTRDVWCTRRNNGFPSTSKAQIGVGNTRSHGFYGSLFADAVDLVRTVENGALTVLSLHIDLCFGDLCSRFDFSLLRRNGATS